MDHTQLLNQLINLEFPPLEGEDEELVRSIFRLVANDVVIFALAMQGVPPVVHLDNTPWVTGILFRNKFGRVTTGQMYLVGPERYWSIGMRLGKLILESLLYREIELYNIEFLLYLFLKIANESIQVLTQPAEAVVAAAVVTEGGAAEEEVVGREAVMNGVLEEEEELQN